MGTRSNIVRENEDGSMDVIYCHWDGYPSNNGALLLAHYMDPKKVDKLIALGGLSSLGPELGRKHSFTLHQHPDHRAKYKSMCLAYGRDRGETDIAAQHYTSGEAMGAALEQEWTEWVYVYRVSEGRWYFTNNPAETWFKCCPKEQLTLLPLTALLPLTPADCEVSNDVS